MKRISFLFVVLYVLSPIIAQTSSKLTGEIIGTTISVDYSTNQQSTVINTIANCFDGDFSTYFASYQRDEGWVGLDLGEKHIIRSIKFCPRAGQSDRVRLAIFEGANKPDFGDAIPLYIIPSGSSDNKFTEININSSKGYRYVRYIGRRDVRCNIAELEFWGYPGEGDNTHVGQLTNLPTISIHTVGSQAVDSREKYIKGVVSVSSDNYFYTDSLEIRGRGNASWGFPKKPYRMKLFNKVQFLGNPAKEKNWTLINNYGDKTLMRNLVAFDISKRMEMAYTPAGRPVDVVLNGEYVGTYQLCDQIEVAEGRVAIDKMKNSDILLPNLSGGYLLEIDGYAYGSPWDPTSTPEPVKFTSPLKQVPVTVKYPKDDEIVPEQFNYIENQFKQMEASIFASNYFDPLQGFRKYIDVNSFMRYFLIGQITGNPDIYWSIYLTKKRNDDKFYFGPVWDFDIAFENDVRIYPTNKNSDWISGGAGNVKEFFSRCMSDTQFYHELKSTYSHYRDNGKLHPDTLLDVIDRFAADMDASQRLNFNRWDILNKTVHQNWGYQGSYSGEVNVLKQFLRDRIAWIDKKLQYVPSATKNTVFENISVFSIEDCLYINNLKGKTKITCVDISGRVIFEDIAESCFERYIQHGVYIIHISDFKGNTKSYKHIIN